MCILYMNQFTNPNPNSSPNSSPDIVANSILLLIIGNSSIIDFIKDSDSNYFTHKLNIPIANICGIDFSIANGVEIAQTYAYAEYHNKDYYGLFSMDKSTQIIDLPNIELDEQTNIEKSLVNWMHYNLKPITKNYKKIFKQLTIIGKNNDILVCSCVFV